MLIYEKIVDGKRMLFGTLKNLPSENDIPITYKDDLGRVIENLEEFNFFYDQMNASVLAEKTSSHLSSSNNKSISAWLGDTLIFGSPADINGISIKEPENMYVHFIIDDTEIEDLSEISNDVEYMVYLTPAENIGKLASATMIIDGNKIAMDIDCDTAVVPVSLNGAQNISFEVTFK